MTEKTHNAKCVHATSVLVKEYPELKLSIWECTWYCCQNYWCKTDGITERDISETEAQRILNKAGYNG
jgi:hypothetical protein